jgi:hypothetical protein
MKKLILIIFPLFSHPVLIGQNWVPMDKGIDCFYHYNVREIYVDSLNDELYIAGIFVEDGNCVPMRGIAYWNGNHWDSIGISEGNAAKYGLCKYNDTLIVYGNFSDSNFITYWAQWNGTVWDSIAGGPNGPVRCYVAKGDSLFIGGWFDHIGTDSTFLLGLYDGQQLTGITPYYGQQGGWVINSMAFYHDTLYVGGSFNGQPYKNIANFAKWDGFDIQVVDPIFNAQLSLIEELVVYQNELYIGGAFLQQSGFAGNFIMKYDGTQFTDVGGGTNGKVTALAVYNGELYVGGYFTQVGGNIQSNNIAKWDGSQWHSLSTDTLSGTFPLVEDIDFFHDSLIISGNFRAINGDTSMQRIAKYNHALVAGTSEYQLPTPLLVYPNPSSTHLFFDFKTSANRSIVISDNLGREVSKTETSERTVSIYLGGVQSGIYFYHVCQDGITRATGKIVHVP